MEILALYMFYALLLYIVVLVALTTDWYLVTRFVTIKAKRIYRHFSLLFKVAFINARVTKSIIVGNLVAVSKKKYAHA